MFKVRTEKDSKCIPQVQRETDDYKYIACGAFTKTKNNPEQTIKRISNMNIPNQIEQHSMAYTIHALTLATKKNTHTHRGQKSNY